MEPLSILLAGFVLASCGAPRPTGAGVQDGRLAPCPSSPNCVSSQAADAAHHVAPISYSVSAGEAMAGIKAAIEGLPRTRIVSATENYLHAEFTSAIFRFVDDLECLVDESTQTIHIRSASRTGKWDFGVNRRRVEGLRIRLFPHLSARTPG